MTDIPKPSFSHEDFSNRFLQGQSVFPPDERIFHQAGCQYDYVAAGGAAQVEGETMTTPLAFRFGEQEGLLSLTPVMPGVLRLRFGHQGTQFDETSPMLCDPLPGFQENDEATSILVGDGEQKTVYTFQGYRVELEKAPFCLRVFSPAGEMIFESEWEQMVGMYTAPAMGLRCQQSEEPGWAFFSWRMRHQDRFFGLGERFTRFEKTGTRATIWEADTCGSNTTDLSYKAVPVLFSTAGWALMLHSSYRSYWEVGSFSYSTGALMVEDNKLDLFLILAPTLKEQVQRYTALTGRPKLPPRWAFGLWMSRAAYETQTEMRDVADRLRCEEIPFDVMNIDGSYLPSMYYDQLGVCVCNLNWEPFPEESPYWEAPEKVFAEFARKDVSICLWINPYLSEDSALYAEARHKGYLVRNEEGSISRLEFNLAAGIIDFTNPEAKAWWQGHLIDLLRKGATTLKVDFGDRVPEDALFYNRKNGREMHNLYVHLYAQAVYEAVELVHGDGAGVIWRRPGYIGSQRFPGCWAGDTQVTFEGMAGALRGGLSAAFSGESFWSHDIGGFVGEKPSDELYIRWAQFGLLSPFARFHGTTPREPWFFGAPAMEVVKHYARLRYALIPYLLACGQESVVSGIPLLRPMVMEFPNEPRIDGIDDQYLLGPDLLVAPVFQAGARSRVVYFPKGQWWNFDKAFDRGAAVNGPGFKEVEAPLERVPLYVRAAAVIPYYSQPPQHLKGPAPREWLLDIYPGDGERRLEIHEPDDTITIHYHAEGNSGRLEISPTPVHFSVRLIDRRPSFLRSTGGATLQPGDEHSTFKVDASTGVQVEFRA